MKRFLQKATGWDLFLQVAFVVLMIVVGIVTLILG